MLELNKIYTMDCLKGLKQLPDNSINCCVTSTIKISNGKVYSMGTDNPVIRIDIKEVEHDA